MKKKIILSFLVVALAVGVVSIASGWTPITWVWGSRGFANGIEVKNKVLVDDSLRVVKTTIHVGAVTNYSTTTLYGMMTADSGGTTMKLHTIAAGDSVLGHIILDRADTTLKVWTPARAWKAFW